MSTGMTRLDAALDAACNLAHHAALALKDQQQGHGLSPVLYRKHIRSIQALTWCALNDLGKAKRKSLADRRAEKERDRRLREIGTKAIVDGIREYLRVYGGRA